jgi:hypothetical protein
VTRAELAKILSISFDMTNEHAANFTDVSTHWAKDYIAAAAGTIPMRGGANFYPDEPATREEVAASIATLSIAVLGSGGTAAIVEPFSDESDIDADLLPRVRLAVESGIITGYDGGFFKPRDFVTRSEISAMICRAL